jgi:hypothetical protein
MAVERAAGGHMELREGDRESGCAAAAGGGGGRVAVFGRQ